MSSFPNRKAVCPDCGKTVTAYVPSGWISSDGPRYYAFRTHTPKGTPGRSPFGRECEGWAKRVPDDAFTDGKPNIDGGWVSPSTIQGGWVPDGHNYEQNWKLVHSGQTRTYYNAGCLCGWRHRKRNGELWFRVNDEDAVTDWVAHVWPAGGTGQEGQ